jgi:hypothetical protein
MQLQVVTFSEVKDGNAPDEWQDGAYGGVARDGTARFVVLDGATGAFDAVRWVDQLVTSFVPQPSTPPDAPPDSPPGADHAGPRPPVLEPAAMRAWFARMQDQWATDVPAFDSIIEENKFRKVGSFATFLGFEITGLDGPEPVWRAVALGDTVLFHVRAGCLIDTFPPIRAGEFGSRPAGVHTQKSSLDEMTEHLLAGSGVLAAGDFLFAATDAMADWMLHAAGRDEATLWETLAGLVHPDVFARLVSDQRKEQDDAKRMKNDDVTLMRLRLLADQPSFVLACR